MTFTQHAPATSAQPLRGRLLHIARAWSLLVLVGVIICAPRPTAAETTSNQRAQAARLPGLSTDEIQRVAPYTADGPVALIEFADSERDELPAVNVLTRVKAPPALLLQLVRDPQRYPEYMRTLSEVEVVSRRRDSVVYDWAWNISLFRLRGRNVMRVYEPANEAEQRGTRITIDSQQGDLGKGRMSLRILPYAEQESLLLISMRLDLRTANYIARKAAQAARSVNRSANMALAYTMALSFAKEAQRNSGQPTPIVSGDLRKPAVDEGGIYPLLERGDLVLMRLQGERLIQCSAFGRIDFPRSLVRRVMLDADGFGSALLPGSKAEVVKQQGDLTIFDWNIAIPLLGVSGQMAMRAEEPTVTVEATSGALSGGLWKFEAKAVQPQRTLLATWAAFDVRKTNMLVRAMANADPFLGHGLSAASELMLVRALRTKTRIQYLELQSRAAAASKGQP